MIQLLLAGLLAMQAPKVKPFDQVPVATGANINESAVTTEIVVHPNPTGNQKSLTQGLLDSYKLLRAGTPVRLSLSPGTYRDDVILLDWSVGKAGQTTFIIEAKQGAIWTGSDIVPLTNFERMGNLIVLPWKKGWGNFGYSWGTKKTIGHRSEMAFVNGEPLTQRILETYEIGGVEQDPAKSGQVTYKYTGMLKPNAVLKPGQFGIAERPENGQFLYIRLPEGAGANPKIEVSTRRQLLNLVGKSNVVLRGITFQHAANDDRDFGSNNVVKFGLPGNSQCNNVLIEKCKMNWNAQTGLWFAGDNWTIRDSEFSYNGGSGIASGKCKNVLWERNKTNFNVWRLWRAGEIGYYTGGFKMHEATVHTVRGHEAIGNTTMGLWWDVHCHDIRVTDIQGIENTVNLQFEIGQGPFIGDRMTLIGGRADDGLIHLWEHGSAKVTNSVFFTNYHGNGFTALFNIRWFGRDEDIHAKMMKIAWGETIAQGNLFVGGPNVKNFAMMDDIRFRDKPDYVNPVYRGISNVFWHDTLKNLPKKWIIDEGRTGDLGARRLPLDKWFASGGYTEQGSRFLNPMFRSVENYDFTISEKSPLYQERSRWPQVALSQQTRNNMKKFFEWSGFTPGVWSALPPE